MKEKLMQLHDIKIFMMIHLKNVYLGHKETPCRDITSTYATELYVSRSNYHYSDITSFFFKLNCNTLYFK